MLQQAVTDLVVTKIFGLTDSTASAALTIDNSILTPSNSILSKLRNVFMEVAANDSDNAIITGGYSHIIERIGKKAYIDGQKVKLYKKGFVRFIVLYGKAMFLEDCITYYLIVKIGRTLLGELDTKFSIRATRYTLKSRIDLQCEGGNATEIFSEVFSTSIFSRVLHYSLDIKGDIVKINCKKIKDNHRNHSYFLVDDDSYCTKTTIGIDASSNSVLYTSPDSKYRIKLEYLDIASMTDFYLSDSSGNPVVRGGVKVITPPVDGNYLLRVDFTISPAYNTNDPTTYSDPSNDKHVYIPEYHVKNSDMLGYDSNSSLITILNRCSLSTGYPYSRIPFCCI